jgi:hypothetical protein
VVPNLGALEKVKLDKPCVTFFGKLQRYYPLPARLLAFPKSLKRRKTRLGFFSRAILYGPCIA